MIDNGSQIEETPMPETDKTLKVISAVRNNPGMGAQTATVIVQGDTPDEAVSLAAKNLAYAERIQLKMERSGIEAMGGTMPVEVEQEAGMPKKYVYQREFRLTEMI